jgi:hypothetical protein
MDGQALMDYCQELDDLLRALMFKTDKELRKAVEELHELSRKSLWR